MPPLNLPTYRKNAIRPNPSAGDPAKGPLAHAHGPILQGDFGPSAAAVRPALGLPSEQEPPAGGQDDEAKNGWR